MRKIIIIILATLILLTGCQANALDDYKEAIKKTQEIEKGKMNVSLKAKLDFEKEGLSEDKIRALSYFDVIELEVNSQYDFSDKKENIIAKTYYNLGGIGFDSIFYMENSKMYLKMPIIKGYISLDIDNTDYQKYSFDEDSYKAFFSPVVDKWNEILKQEDVFKGKKTYVLTDEGQIKTTTYTIDASQEQLKTLGDELVSLLKNENALDMFFNKSSFDNDIDKEVIFKTIENYISRLVLEEFKGIAYVDFDGRLIKQEYNIKVGFDDVKIGELKSINASFTMEYLSLGEEQVFEFPVINKDEWININKQDEFQMILPEKIFN